MDKQLYFNLRSSHFNFDEVKESPFKSIFKQDFLGKKGSNSEYEKKDMKYSIIEKIAQLQFRERAVEGHHPL